MLRITVAQELQHKNRNVAKYAFSHNVEPPVCMYQYVSVLAVCTVSVRSMYYPTPVLNVLAVLFVSVCTTSVSSVKCTGKKRKKKSGRMQKTGLHLRMGSALSFVFLFVDNQ